MSGTIIFVSALNAWEILVYGAGNVMGPATTYSLTGTMPSMGRIALCFIPPTALSPWEAPGSTAV